MTGDTAIVTYRLHELVDRHKMTATEQARQLGISRAMLNKMMSEGGASVGTVKKLCAFYGVSMDWLTGMDRIGSRFTPGCTCGECSEFIQCQCGECGICRLMTQFPRSIYWTAADEECGAL